MLKRSLLIGTLLVLFCGCLATAAPTVKITSQCPPKPILCTQVYMPASCTVKVSGKELSTNASNACHAKAELVAKLCKEKNGEAAIPNIRCNAVPE